MDIRRERPRDAAAVETLVAAAFGPGRFAKTVYRLRDGAPPLADLSLVVETDGALVGTLRFWPIVIGGRTPSLLLGPLAVARAHRSNGVGAALMAAGLDRAAAAGHRCVVLVGDEPYYRRFGFRRDPARGLVLPGPVDYDRVLARELTPGALAGVAGLVSSPVAATRTPRRVPMVAAPLLAAA